MRLTEEEKRARLEEKAAIVDEWFVWIRERYESFVSRVETGMAGQGFDSNPDSKPCEHRREWRRGKLCLACDTTGWRKATKQEKKDGLARDPYSFNLPKEQTKMVESDSSRRAHHAALLDAEIDKLRLNERVREGTDILEDRSLRQYRVAMSFPQQALEIMDAFDRVRDRRLSNRDRDALLYLRVPVYRLDNDHWLLCLFIAKTLGKKLRPPN